MKDREQWQAARRVQVGGRSYSPEELEWARQNLGTMRRQLRGNTFLLGILALAFVLGIVFYLLADAINTGTIVLPDGWRADLIGDFLYNLGLILWTSVVISLFLEVGVEYSHRRAEQYVEDVEMALQTLGYDVPDEPETENEPDLTALNHKLETLVAAVERLQTEITALKADQPPKDNS